MTDIPYHPTRVRALRDQFRALRAAEFPWTADTVYLNNAAIGPIPERTRRALDEFTAKRTAPHLLPDRELQAGLQAARVAVARFLNAEPDEIALATNTSHGLNLAARALPLQRGDVVLVSDREFPANVYPWMLLKKQGVEVELAPCAPEGWPDEDYLVERLHDPRVRVLAVSFVQFSNGYRADLARLGVACRANGTFLVVDGIQGVGNSVLDVRETPVDILACGGQKWLLAPWGSGFVYVRRELISVLEPAVAGWMAFEGTDDFSRLTEYNPTFRSDARRFEMVTLPFQDFYGMTASVGMLADLGIDDLAQYARTLHDPVLRCADETGVRVVSPRPGAPRSATVCLDPAHAVAASHPPQRAHGGGSPARGVDVQPKPRDEHHTLDDDRPHDRVPQAEPQRRAARVQRHVGTMGDDVDHPMAHDEQRHHQRRARLARAHAVEVRKQGAPPDECDQAVRDRDRVEPQRQEGVRPRDDVGVLPPQQQEHRPEQIREGGSREQRAQRGPRRGALGREREGVVPDEHGSPLALKPQQPVVLLALAQQQIAAREPVGGIELSVDVLHPLLIDVHSPLFDLPPSLTL